MPVAAKRFAFQGEETNLAVTSFIDSKTSELFNSPNNELKEMGKDMSDFLSQSIAIPEIDLSVPDDFKDLTRIAKDSWTSVKDLSKLSVNDLNKHVEGLFPDNPGATAAFKKLSQSCKTSSTGKFSAGKPFDTNIDCNGKSRASGGGCTSGINDIISKLSGGSYNSAFNDLNRSLSNLVSLATMGYKANMCGVFTALTGGIGSDLVKSKGASMILGELGSSGNLRGVFDLAKSTAGPGFAVIKNIPNGISNVFSNFKLPFDSKETELASLSESVSLSMESFDNKWDRSSFDNMASVSYLSSFNEDYSKAMRGEAMKFSVDEDDLDFIPKSSVNLARTGVASLKSGLSGLGWA